MTKKIFFLLIILPLSLLSNSASIDSIKVAYIYNVAKFITWDKNRELSNFTICSYPNSSINESLIKLKNQKIKDKVIEIKNDIEDNKLRECHILFISKNRSSHLNQILQTAKKEQVLTISDYPKFTTQGVIINLYEEQDKLHFKINQKEAQRSKIDISSQLLGVAKIVKTDNK